MPTNGKIIYAINKYSIEIDDGIVKKSIKVEDIYNLIKDKSDIEKLDIKEVSYIKIKRIINSYDRIKYLDDILYLMPNKYSHLRSVRNLVNLDNLINYILPDDILLEKIRLDYSNRIIDRLLEKYYDYDSAKLFSKMKEDIDKLDAKINIKIVKKLNEYYVRKITV